MQTRSESMSHKVDWVTVLLYGILVFWGWLWGIPGMFLALPLLTILKTIAESVDDLRVVAELLSD